MMDRRLLRHVIVGTEAGQPRPPAYMRPGRTRRSCPPRHSRGGLITMALITIALLGMVVWSVAG